MVAEKLREYEMVIVLSPEATEEEITATTEHLDGLITEQGGSVAEHDTWGLRPLAFPVENFNEGNYVLTRFSLDGSAVAGLNGSLSASQDVLRFLVSSVHKPREKTEE